jgi:hypothetical protein
MNSRLVKHFFAENPDEVNGFAMIVRCDQIGCRSDLVRVFRRPASPAVFGIGRYADKPNRHE